MNKSIIRKCVGELSKESPDLSYIRGMMEAFLDMDEEIPASQTSSGKIFSTPPVQLQQQIKTDEDQIDPLLRAYIGDGSVGGLSS